MTVIKAHFGDLVRPLAPPVGAAAASAASEPPPEVLRIAALEAEVDQLREAIAASAADAARAADEARRSGREEGLAAAARSEEERLDCLRGGLAEALVAWRERLDETERLAVLISRGAVEKLVEDQGGQCALVLGAIARQVALLRRDAVVAVQVSAADFPDAAALAEAAAVAGGELLDVNVSADLEAGECRLALKLGFVDIGPRTQWMRLSALFDEALAEGDGA